MRGGVFPLNPNAINRSKMLRTNPRIKPSSNMSNLTINNQVTGSSGQHHGAPTIGMDQTNYHQQLVTLGGSSRSSGSGFTSSHEAIAAFDQILAENKSPLINGNDNDKDDEDFSRNVRPLSSSANTISWSKRKNRKKAHKKSSKAKRKQVLHPTQFIGFDASDDMGICCSSGEFLLASFHTSDDPAVEAEGTTSEGERTKSIQAITAASEAVFVQATHQQSETAIKRTVLKRNAGEIMTEEAAINQGEPKKKKTKAPSSTASPAIGRNEIHE